MASVDDASIMPQGDMLFRKRDIELREMFIKLVYSVFCLCILCIVVPLY